MSPQLFTIVFAFVCVAAFLVGLRVFRSTEPVSGASVEQARRFGRLLMMASVGMLLFLIAVIVHGDLGVVRAARAIQ
jgi:hypothetical protein